MKQSDIKAGEDYGMVERASQDHERNIRLAKRVTVLETRCNRNRSQWFADYPRRDGAKVKPHDDTPTHVVAQAQIVAPWDEVHARQQTWKAEGEQRDERAAHHEEDANTVATRLLALEVSAQPQERRRGEPWEFTLTLKQTKRLLDLAEQPKAPQCNE